MAYLTVIVLIVRTISDIGMADDITAKVILKVVSLAAMEVTEVCNFKRTKTSSANRQ
ncbi:MAG TPA: hypothetical protein GXZ43_02205 [Clostridiaceae bacterium]|nr:hypothetical protein [Clostridiaceae bacterium]